MSRKTSVFSYFILTSVCFLSLPLGLVGCSSFKTYRVQHIQSISSISAPEIDATPVVSNSDFNVYRSSSTSDVYFVIPTKLFLTRAINKDLMAVSLERRDGNYLILAANAASPASLIQSANAELRRLNLSVRSVSFYPIDSMRVKPITDPRDPKVITVTALPGYINELTPFSVMLIFQVEGDQNIVSFKQLIDSAPGYILALEIGINRNTQQAEEVVDVQLLVSEASITNLTM